MQSSIPFCLRFFFFLGKVVLDLLVRKLRQSRQGFLTVKHSPSLVQSPVAL
ncbi:hypothetical protein SynMEDNS5_01686 [Synechococcus sp. MEDNS5]|nr:hypothetical protein SynMEDNS5_01686 [Synechococcus sp. MEDNS5]